MRERVSAEVSPFPRRGGAHDGVSPRRLRPPLTSPELQARHVPRRPRPRRPPHTARTSICGQGRIPTRGKPGARCGRLRSQNCCARWGHLVLLAAAPDTATPPRFPRGAASDLPALLRQARLGLPTGMPGPGVPCEGQGLSRQSAAPQNQQQARGPSSEPSTARRWPRASAGRRRSCWLWGRGPATAAAGFCCYLRHLLSSLTARSRAAPPTRRVCPAPVPSVRDQGWGGVVRKEVFLAVSVTLVTGHPSGDKRTFLPDSSPASWVQTPASPDSR